MTTVKTPATPPPRLPVRDKAAALGRGWGGVTGRIPPAACRRAGWLRDRSHSTCLMPTGPVAR